MSDPSIAIHYAETDADCIVIHQFLCIVAQPVLFCPIDPRASMDEVVRVRDEGASLMVEKDGHLIGALGLVQSRWWYNPATSFLTDRWFFVLPQFQHLGAATLLLAEAAVIGARAGIDIVINGHMRRRAKNVGNGIVFTHPTVIRAA